MTTAHFAVEPNFSHFAFSDDAKVSEAIVHILAIRNRKDNMDELLKRVIEETGARTIGELRQLSDHDWREIKIPAICSVYLKYLVRQSARRAGKSRSFLEVLQDDFNYGQPFDMSLYQNNLNMLSSMGFQQEEALEALVITDNKGIEPALEILFQPDKTFRDRKRAEAVVAFSRRIPDVPDPQLSADPRLATVLRQLELERQQRNKSDIDMRTERAAHRIQMYCSFIQAMIGSDHISADMWSQFQTFKKDKNISDLEHQQALKHLGISQEKLEGMKKFQEEGKSVGECVVCLDKKRSHLIMPCMHFSLCEDCASDFAQANKKCPVCSKPIQKVERVFM
jgi:hypothetical protein